MTHSTSAELMADPGRQARFETFVADLRTAFQRSDQFLRFRAYLRGLLEATGRRNVGGIAAAAAGAITVEADLAQALQHFVSQSPWDSERLLNAAQTRTLPPVTSDDGTRWVVHDGVFPKKGRSSVGVLRQFARSAQQKLNCQVAVVVSQVGPTGYYPLAARLYLPGGWVRDHAEVVEKTIPERHQAPTSKAEVARQLLAELRATRPPCPLAAEAGYLAAHEFHDALAEWNGSTQVEHPPAVTAALVGFDWLKTQLGLDHFEGRSWAGWHHHVALVFTAYYFLAREAAGPQCPPFAAA